MTLYHPNCWHCIIPTADTVSSQLMTLDHSNCWHCIILTADTVSQLMTLYHPNCWCAGKWYFGFQATLFRWPLFLQKILSQYLLMIRSVNILKNWYSNKAGNGGRWRRCIKPPSHRDSSTRDVNDHKCSSIIKLRYRTDSISKRNRSKVWSSDRKKNIDVYRGYFFVY